MHLNLRSFLKQLRREGELHTIDASVDPYLELAEIHRRVIDQGGPALLFTNVKGSAFPVVTNLFGTSRRVELAFGPRPEELMKEAVQLVHRLMPPTLGALWGEKKWLKELMKVGFRSISPNQAPVLEVSQPKIDLQQLPVLTSWQEDGGPFVTLPLVYTQSPNTKQHNLGMYRMQVFDTASTGMHWQIHKGGGFHYHEAEQMNQSLPVHVFLGGPPALIASAIAPVPEFLPELLLTSLIMGSKLPVVKDETTGYHIVAEAEFLLKGSVASHERKMEGPFGDHYGYYSLAHPFPIFQVDQVFHRRDAIYPATIVGKPRQEDYFLGEFLQKLLSPAFPMVMSGVKELWTYAETGFHPLAAARVRESYKRETLAHAFRILGEGQLTLTKFLMLTDQFVPLEDFPALFTAILERFDPSSDLIILGNTSMDTLDYTGRRLNHGSKAILLGVGEKRRELPRGYQGSALPGIEHIVSYVPGVLVLESKDSFALHPNLAEELLEHYRDELKDWPFVFLVDDRKAVEDQTSFLWTIFTRFDPAFDIYAHTTFKHHSPNYQLPIIVDARMKPDYPAELEVDPSIKNLVDSKWKEYQLK
ncbi:UbiD family decarboxylase [Shimazuella kribbensis]|uniref:UbiD family decarboxylase n=1 Tax=Shimazuella kribbensis TaxID=139808 RepID=UPI000416AF69|nr:UbiD family decarboxylase [Shimazuella kribbensis]